MKQFIFFAIMAFYMETTLASNLEFEYYGEDDFIFEDKINETLEAMRPDIPDPLSIANFSLSFPEENSTLLVGEADLSNLEVTGLRAFQVTALQFSMLRLNFTVRYPSLNLNTDYIANLQLLHLIPFYGSGKANIHINGLEIKGTATATINNGIQVKDLRLQLYVEDSTFDIHGALNNEVFSTICSEVLNDMFGAFVDNHQDVVSNILSPIVEALINGILAGQSIDTTAAPTTETTAL